MKKSKIIFDKVFPSTMRVNGICIELKDWKVDVPVNLLTKDEGDFSDIIAVLSRDIYYDDKLLFKCGEKIPFFCKSSKNSEAIWKDWDIICFDFKKRGVDGFDESLLREREIYLKFKADGGYYNERFGFADGRGI